MIFISSGPGSSRAGPSISERRQFPNDFMKSLS